MATFRYKAIRADQTPVEGHLDADDLKSALHALEQQGFIVSSIHQLEIGQAETDTSTAAPSPAQLPEAEQLALRRQLSRILETGKPLAPALLAYARELPPGRQRRRLQRIANQLTQGHDPSDELGSGQIDEAWIPLLSAAASSGDPSQVLGGIIDESQQAGNLRRQFAAALAYPLLLLALTLVLLSMFAWWIAPTFQEIFVDFGVTLPSATRLVFGTSETIRKSHGLVILIPALALAGIMLFFGYVPRSRFRDGIIRRIPVLGNVVRLSDRARFTRYLADLMEAEVPVADALRISGRNMGDAALRLEASQLAAEWDLGAMILPNSVSFRRRVPRAVIHALQLNAKPSAAAEILRELSWMYDQQTGNRLAWISSVAGPFGIVFMGTVVGFYFVALFLPLASLIDNLS